MVGDLCRQKGLADFGRADKQVSSGIQQAVNDGQPAVKGGLVQLSHGNCVEIVRVGQPLHPPAHFLKTFTRIFNLVIDFRLGNGYTINR